MTGSIGQALTATNDGTSARARKDADAVIEASDALRQAREFMSEVNGPPESEKEQERLTRTLHALDHASRLAEVAGEKGEFVLVPSGSEGVRAAELCAEAMRNAVLIAGEVGALPDDPDQAAAVEALDGKKKEVAANGAPTEQAMVQLEHCAKTLSELQLTYRKVTLSSVAGGAVSADEAIAYVDTVRRLEALARHAWRSAAHLVDSKSIAQRGTTSGPQKKDPSL
jgi:phosphate:Na+ symporter